MKFLEKRLCTLMEGNFSNFTKSLKAFMIQSSAFFARNEWILHMKTTSFSQTLTQIDFSDYTDFLQVNFDPNLK